MSDSGPKLFQVVHGRRADAGAAMEPAGRRPKGTSAGHCLRSSTAISAIGLRKSYGDKTILDGIDLRIPTGSVFALLGPNGAGKTTAVKILSTLIGAVGGQAQVGAVVADPTEVAGTTAPPASHGSSRPRAAYSDTSTSVYAAPSAFLLLRASLSAPFGMLCHVRG